MQRDPIPELRTSVDRRALGGLLRHARERLGLSQIGAATLADVRPETVRRLEQGVSDVRFGTLGKYLGALGYQVELTIQDNSSNEVVGSLRVAASDEDEASPPQSTKKDDR